MIKITQDFIPATLPTRPGTKLNLKFITIHNTDNATKGAGAAAHNKYIRGADAVKRKVSWHFTVDDKAIFQHLPENEVGFHASSGTGNAQSIGIEICMNADMNTVTGYDNASDLVAALAVKHGLKLPGCMKQHGDWTAKNCPRILRAGQVISWQAFLEKCQAKAEALKGGAAFSAFAELLQVEEPDPAALTAPDSEEMRAALASIDAAMADHDHSGPESDAEAD